MLQVNNSTRRGLAVAVSLLALITAMPAVGGTAQPSTLSMLEAMVANGVISQAQADKIIKDAETRDAARAATGDAAPLPEGTKRVAYVPDIVKQQLRDEIKGQVLAQAKAENWAAPNTHPEWTERIKFKGDIRGRYEGTYFPDGNAVGTDVADNWDFNAINTGKPIDVNATSSADRYRNADQNRERFRLRARLGVESDLGEGFSTGMRIATGDGNSPVSTNQSLGGSGGNFSKYQIWLDRAFIRWDAVQDKKMALGANVGRFDNPFFGTDLIWDDDLGFDGVAVSGKYEVAKGVTPFLTMGAFPIYNTSFNVSSEQPEKQKSQDKWLYGLQAGTDWKPSKNIGLKFGAGYYHFTNIEGKESEPCALWDSSISCDTDDNRPSFAQKGNTYMALRREASGRPAGNTAEYQYFGLATPFRELSLTGRATYDGFGRLRVAVDGEFVKNLALDDLRVNRVAYNNLSSDGSNTYEGGDTGYMLRLTVGTPKLAERWDWNTSLAYKYLESDAVVDGLTDSDFGMGGTNLKGFVLGGNLALSKNVWTSLRWMSADSIAGASYSVDTVQADLTAKF